MKPNDPRLYWYLEKLEELQLNPKARVVGLSKEEFLEYVDFLFGPVLDNQGKTIFIEDFRYIPYVTDKILKINLREYLNAKGNVPQEIIQAAEELGDEGEIERTRLEARNKVEAFIKRQEQLKAANIAQAQEDISRKAQVMVKASLPGSLARDVEVVKKLSGVIENELTAAYLETILPDDLSPQVLQKVTQHVIETAELPEQLMAAEPNLPANVAQLIKANLKNLTWSPQTTATIKEINKTGFVLPRPLREKIPTTGGPVSIVNAIRHPQLFLQKVALFPIAKTTEVIAKASLDNEAVLLQEIKKLRADSRASSQEVATKEWQLYVSSRFRTNNKFFSSLTGLTKADLEQFRIHLTVTRGLGPTDLGVQYIDNQIEKMAMFGQRSRLAGLFQRSLQFNREAGLIQPKIEVGQREYFLPRTNPISGFGQKVISFGEQIGYYRQFMEYPGIGVIRSVPLQKFADFRSFIARKTLQPIFARLGQTAIGQGIKSGLRGIISKGTTQSLIKIGTTILTKLGLTKLASAIGTAIAPGIGTAIGLVVGFVIDKAKDLLSKFKQLFTKPEFALGLGAIGGLFIISVPGTMGIAIGAPLLALSGVGLAANTGGILGGASAATVAILAAFFAPLGAPIAALVVSIILGLFFLTLFIVFLTASAFILPYKPSEVGAPSVPGGSAYFSVEKNASQEKFTNEKLEENPSVTYTFEVTAQQPVILTSVNDQRSLTCQPGSPAQLDTAPISLPHPDEPITKWNWESDDNHQLDLDPSFADCRICNTVKVIANVVNAESGETIVSGEMDTATVCIEIGHPPEDCPSGWPTTSLGSGISQGPNTAEVTEGWCTSHYGEEAIDIRVPINTPVYATHEGKVRTDYSMKGGKFVAIDGFCEGQSFTSYYYHLNSYSVSDGEEVIKGTEIGKSGNSGSNTTGPHLHYEFRGGLKMARPNIDGNVTQGCCTICTVCHGIRCEIN